MDRRRIPFKLVVGLALVALGSLAFGTLSPSASGVTTSVTIAPRFLGTVSATSGCQAGREVVVKRVKRGKDKVIGVVTSENDGDWALPTNRQRGRYRAVAKARVNSGTGYGYAGVSCDKGKSPTIKL
jgi:hypothetical protein